MIMLRRMRHNAIKLQGQNSSAFDLARGRLVMMSVFFMIAYALLFVRAFDLTVIQAHKADIFAAERAAQVAENVKSAPTRRADIFDRNGVLLATTLKISSLYADTRLISDPEFTAQKLSKIFPDQTYGELLQKLQSGKRFIWLKRRITPEQQQAVLTIGEPGLEFEYEFQRFYPQESLFSHMVGYTSLDNDGLAGVERSFDGLLAEGKPLTLSLDIRLQHALRRETARTMEEFKGIGAVGLIMNVNTGEVLAGTSLPDFNPHQAGRAEDAQIFNRLTLGAYELGSVFKIFSTAAFFETRDVPINVKFDASEPIRVGRFTINDYHAEDRVLSAPEVFMYSSNIGSAMMGQAVGTEKLRAFYKDLGLLTPLDFEVKEVATPLVPNPWREVHTLTASYGHGVATTPLQMGAAVSSIINGGYSVKPTLIKSDGLKANEDVRVISAETAQRMRQFLRLVVSDGTGGNADVPGYRVGGKTGTAEKIVNGRYDRKKKISSFVGVFPMDAPKYLVFIAVDEPVGNKRTWGYATGGWVAAPAVQKTIASMVSILGIPPLADSTPEGQFGSSLKQYISAKGKN